MSENPDQATAICVSCGKEFQRGTRSTNKCNSCETSRPLSETWEAKEHPMSDIYFWVAIDKKTHEPVEVHTNQIDFQETSGQWLVRVHVELPE